MLKDKKIIIIAILIILYFICLIPFKLFNKQGIVVYLGSITKVNVNNGEISVDNDNYKVDIQKVKLYFNERIEDAYLKSDSSNLENGNYEYGAYNESNEIFMVTDGLLAFQGSDNIKIKNLESTSYVSSQENNSIKEFLKQNNLSGSIDTVLKYEYDLNSDGTKEKIYNLKVSISEENNYTVVLISDSEKSTLLNYENGGSLGKYTNFYKLIDFNSDGSYEIVVYNYNGNNSLSTYKIYEYNGYIREIN